eukprot:2483908-Pleurochrysis_carterae.AAC.4
MCGRPQKVTCSGQYVRRCLFLALGSHLGVLVSPSCLSGLGLGIFVTPVWLLLLGPHFSARVSLWCLSGPEDSSVLVILCAVVVSRPWSASRRAHFALKFGWPQA